jgi:integrase
VSTNRYPGVYKRGKTWSFRAQFGDGDDRWGVSGGGYPSARAAWDAKLQAIEAARPMHGIAQRPDATLTLASYLDAWLADHTSTLRPSTASAHRSRVNGIKATSIAGLRLRSLTESHYRALVAELRLQSPSHTNLVLKIGTLKAALNAAVRAGLIPNHPLDTIKVSRTTERFVPGFWSVATVQKFLAHRKAANDPLYLTWHLAIVTGLRRGELHGLRWEDVDLDAGLLHVRRQRVEVRGVVHEYAPKTASSEAPVFLDAGTVELLRAATRTSDYVVNDPRTGRPYEQIRTFARDWKKAQDYANVPTIRFHDLRHTSASLLAASGVPLVLAQQRLRHWSPAMTARYTHALDGMGAEAANSIGALVSGA